jgi:hypothetical protein
MRNLGKDESKTWEKCNPLSERFVNVQTCLFLWAFDMKFDTMFEFMCNVFDKDRKKY